MEVTQRLPGRHFLLPDLIGVVRGRWRVVLGTLSALALVAVSLTASTGDDNGASSPLERDLRVELLARANALPRMRSLLVSVGDQLVEEQYYRGASRQRPANLKSASKSVISLLVGIAIEQEFLTGVHQPIADFFPDYFSDQPDPGKTAITIEDLLTMRSGLETTSNRNYGRFVQSGNWVRHVLSRPLVDRPGGRRIYSTGSTHLLSAIITKASGMTTLEFGRRYLAEPLGFRLAPWLQDPQGIYFGGNEMHLTPRDMLAIGQLYLSSGTYGDQRVVSEEWVRESFVPRSRSERSGREYGYGWWMRALAGYRTYYAWGYGGQFIFVIPDLETVVTMTSSPVPGDGRRDHLRELYAMVENQIIPAVEQRFALSQLNDVE